MAANSEPAVLDMNSCLPLSLQDHCLITIINELDKYPIDSLATLPLHMRRQLLSNLPVFDLNKLDETPVAEGIDTDEIWRSLKTCSEVKDTFSDLFVTETPSVTSDIVGKYFQSLCESISLEPVLLAATKERSLKERILLHLMLKIISETSNSTAEMVEQYGIEFDPDDYALVEVVDSLMSILGHHFLVDLPGAKKWNELPQFLNYDSVDKYGEYESVTLESFCQLWEKQSTPLAMFTRVQQNVNYKYDDIVRLVPSRLLSVHQSTSPLDLLNCIVVDCGLQPRNLYIHTDQLYQVVCNLEVSYTAGEDCRLFLTRLFKRVVVLALINVFSDQSDMLHSIFNKDGNASTLKALEISSTSQLDLGFLSPFLLTLPSDPSSSPQYRGLSVLKIGYPVQQSSLPQLTALIEQQHSLCHLYLCLQDSCQTESEDALVTSANEQRLYHKLSMLFDRENFQYLTIAFACTRHGVSFRSVITHTVVFPFAEFLHRFMCASCVFNKFLCFEGIYSQVVGVTGVKPLVMSHDMTPECGTQHKMLLYDNANNDLIISSLLQLPDVRLHDLAFNFAARSKSLFSQMTSHPNLNVTHFLINFAFGTIIDPRDVQESLSSICEDFEKLFQIPTLREVSLTGEWLCCSEVKKAVVIGLQQQSQVCSLQKICFGHNSIAGWSGRPYILYGYTEAEFKELWTAIFSLPQIDQLELDFFTESSITERLIDMAYIVSDCWREFGFEKKKLKTLQLSLLEYELSGDYLEGKLEPFMAVTHKLKIRVYISGESPEIRDYDSSY